MHASSQPWTPEGISLADLRGALWRLVLWPLWQDWLVTDNSSKMERWTLVCPPHQSAEQPG